MPRPVEEEFHDLLQPIKDPEKSFQVDIAQLLHAYITSFVQGRVPPNFNSAALLLQGSSSIYGKKVEYLHNLATQLYENLVKHKKDEQGKKDNTTNKPREKHKDNKFNDPFFSTEIKLGKNLSYLRKKTIKNTTNKKTSKKVAKKHTFIPVDLLPFEGEEKGDVFYDTVGDPVGNKGDFTLNKCKVTASGWLTLPSVCPDKIPAEDAPPDYSIDESMFNNADSSDLNSTNDHNCGETDMPSSTPDEGVFLSSQTPTEESSSPQFTLSQETDEGVGSMSSTPLDPSSEPSSQPMDVESSADPTVDGIENIPIDGSNENIDLLNKSSRRSMRQALKSQDQNEILSNDENNDPPSREEEEEEIVVVKKAIQKKNTCNLPSSLKKNGHNGNKGICIAEFCARTFFSMDLKKDKNGMLPIETIAFRNNSNFMNRLLKRMEELKNSNRKNKKPGENDDDEEIDVVTEDPDPDDDAVPPDPLTDADIVIQNDPNELPIPANDIPTAETSQNELPPSPAEEEDAPARESLTQQEIRKFTKELSEFGKNADIAKRVKAWQNKISPFLNELDHRESFDINVYGSRILNSFEQLEGKQRRETKSFRDFCSGMEKWQIHRYFMALLPLANIGNVVLETEEKPDGEEEILITLISKKMHHLRLEEFGNEHDSEK